MRLLYPPFVPIPCGESRCRRVTAAQHRSLRKNALATSHHAQIDGRRNGKNPRTGGQPLEWHLAATYWKLNKYSTKTTKMMKTIGLTLTLITAVFGMAQTPEKITLEEAIRIAKENAFQVLAAKADAKKAGAVVSEARSVVLPQIGVNGSYTRFNKEGTAILNPMDPPIVTRPIDSKQIALTLAQSIDITGVYSLAISGALALKKASDYLVEAAMDRAEQSAKSAFLQILKSKELVEVANEQLENTKKQLDRATKRNKEGAAAKFDVIRFEAEVSSAEQLVIQSENGFKLTQAFFNQVLARDTGIPVEPIRPSGLPEVKKTMQDLIAFAKQERPDVRAAVKTVEYFVNFRKAQEKGNLPTLNLSANLTHNPDPGAFGGDKTTGSATAVLSFPIFEGGRTKAKVSQAKQEEEKSKIQLEQILLGVELEVRQAYLNVESTKKVIEAAQRNVALAKEALRLANVRYENGVNTTVEVSDANVQYVRARTAEINAIYDYWNAVADLQKAVSSEDI